MIKMVLKTICDFENTEKGNTATAALYQYYCISGMLS